MAQVIQVDVFHENLGLKMPELRFKADANIGEIMENLYRRTGTEVAHMKLWLTDCNGQKKEVLDDTTRLLSNVIPPEYENCGYTLLVQDTNSESVSFSPFDENETPKYEAKSGRADFQEFRRQQRKGSLPGTPPTATTGMELAANFDEGQRVVLLKSKGVGTVRYVGKCSTAAPGFFVGIELDKPNGKHDGEVKGKRLFQCAPNHGVLVRPDTIRPCTYEDEMNEQADEL